MNGEVMAKEAKVKFYKAGSRHTFYLRKELVTDSAFPFKPGQELIAKIVGNKVVIESSREESHHKAEK